MIDRRPRLIAKCTDAADVMAAVRMAKTNGLRVSIRGGGHNAAGLGIFARSTLLSRSWRAPPRHISRDRRASCQ
jgi:FAD/FMN-containing dehydrogenase